MFRKKFAGEKRENKDSIIWRGHEVTRIEAFSDAVFAFAIALLIVALEVPKTYKALMECMTFLRPLQYVLLYFMIWYAQNMFFRRFGLHDIYTLILNGILLFFVLFFVYPLKFLFSSIFSGHFDIENISQLAKLFYIYSGGFACIYILFGLMYYNAIRNQENLNLTTIEIFETRSHMLSYLTISFIAICSILLAFLGKGFIDFAGYIYLLIGPSVTILYSIRNKKKRMLHHSMDSVSLKQPGDNEKPMAIDKVEDDILTK
jgi:uncharacterized membrane protein